MWGIWSWTGPFYYLMRALMAVAVLDRLDDHFPKYVESPSYNTRIDLAITGLLQYGLFVLLNQHFGPHITLFDWTLKQGIEVYGCGVFSSLVVFLLPNLHPLPIRPAFFPRKQKLMLTAMLYPGLCLLTETLAWLIAQAFRGVYFW